ncbi:DNA-binding response regulator, NarL/FixJ family, contains REC and HTH domains [Promicromonospora thailandica]|uniref:DNA-binding response regulator, NarL/FixJ family, contains REC and HTH domains n=2 Tax=Promicromonospora thailandica TaxID=765201 RepID=A0A9X2JTA3_9MICO|nr:DNA-binding response regulator, NarL/FixJ family, contains REC and HTH domains [Promicromonospora thailandica]
MTVPRKIAVALWTSGRAADEGVGAWFDMHPRFVCLPFRERPDADVLLFIAPQAAGRAIAAMGVAPGSVTRPSVLVTDRLSPRQVTEATDRGMARFLNHGVTGMSEVAEALIAVVADAGAQGAGGLRSFQEDSAGESSGLDVAGAVLSPREIEVFRRLAAGSRIAEISADLNYSERTIKGIVHEVVNRFGFRNRVQAVAYGIRTGAF